MDNPRAEKVAVVAEVKDRLDGAEAVVLTEYRGLNVRELAELRKALGEAGGDYKIYKNTMVRFAAKELDLEIEELLVGPTALAFTGTRPDGSDGDPVTVAKALTEFSKGNDKLVIKGGLLEGRLLTTDEITALSKIAPREELLARLAGGMAAPMQQFAALLQALPQKLAYALSALIEQGGAPGAPESAAPAEDAAEENADEAPAEDAASDEPEAEAAADEAPAEDEGDAADDGGESADDAPAEAEASEEDTAGDAGDEESGDASTEDAASADDEGSAEGGDSKES